ncbi:MAG: trehalose-phosphatase [Thermoplasmataceae archaeon]|jgi:trehalose 6-phosphate phosphatase
MSMETGISEIEKAFTTLLNKDPAIFLDYDGTLVPIQPEADAATAERELLDLLHILDTRYTLWIVTGRTLDSITGFIGTGFNIIGLHGLAMRTKDGIVTISPMLERYRPIFMRFMEDEHDILERFPGVVIKDKGGAISFSLWGMEEPDIQGLEDFLRKYAEDLELDFYPGKRIYELRIPGINKGKAIREIRDQRPALIIGDDITDEDAFSLNKDAITVKVGAGDTEAGFRIQDYLSVRELLKAIASQKPETS